jgi:hypothetical protein
MFLSTAWYDIGMLCALVWFTGFNLYTGFVDGEVQGLMRGIRKDFYNKAFGLIAFAVFLTLVLLPLEIIVWSLFWPATLPYSFWLFGKRLRKSRRSVRPTF